ncbi:MAG: 50S ribosomal protein L33 [Bacilli bacterium]|nr:50S ribosomal protein L33 [Bacilli bacterium]MDY6430599.1 50S ribosomal protein L33 [Bacilli bacterium]
MGREKVFLICSECLSRNYSVTRKKDDKERLTLNKYCSRCGKYTLHKQSK